MALRAVAPLRRGPRLHGARRWMSSEGGEPTSTVVGGRRVLTPASTMSFPWLARFAWHWETYKALNAGLSDRETVELAKTLKDLNLFRKDLPPVHALGSVQAMRMATVPFDVRDLTEGAAAAYDVVVDAIFGRGEADLQQLVLPREWPNFKQRCDFIATALTYEEMKRNAAEPVKVGQCWPRIRVDGDEPWIGLSAFLSVALERGELAGGKAHSGIALTYFQSKDEDGNLMWDEAEWFVEGVSPDFGSLLPS